MESPLMLNTMRERMPGANVPLPYGGRVTGSNSLAYEGNDCAGRGAHAILSALFNKYDNVLFAVFVLSLLCSFWEGTNLPRKSPYKIVLTKQEREELERRANKYTLPYFIVARAKMMLLAEQGLSNDEIANSLSTRREIVSRWRKRFFEKRLGGLEDFPRPGRPRVFPPRAGRAR